MREAIKQLCALAQDRRLAAALFVRQEGTIHACAIAEGIGMGPTGLSPHLKILENAGVLAFERQGNRKLFRVDDNFAEKLEAVAQAWDLS